MSDDVSALFAKKKEKKTKKNVFKMDEVGEILERKAKRQEERMNEEVDDDKRAADEEAYLKKTAQEESEWIDYGDQNVGRIEGLKIKDMNAEDAEADESQHSDHEKEKDHESKVGWGHLQPKKEEEELMPQHSVPIQTSQARYVPPTVRYGRHHQANIDITSEDMFPTIGAAEQIEKTHKEDKKNSPWGRNDGGGAYTTQSSGGGGGAGRFVPPHLRGSGGSDGGSAPWTINAKAQRDSAIAEARRIGQMASSGPIRPAAAPVAPAAVPAAPAPASAASAAPPAEKKNAYVPPHLRNRNPQ